ncbi:hypothetical protein GWI33_020632 [Rhynchophorus ferrugineus]|uniref:Glutathione peroxidase n=1 Tax=Rhynchophorus ferrugineus TaxID=354439 RepID=A0A834HVY3_RHYFE|nr:hypothetical protein GWI33_020632 [Rhynchophorus ferrugineus]
MPPKKKDSKVENNEISNHKSPKPKKSAPKPTEEPSTRVLRTRKPAEVVDKETVPKPIPKAKQNKTNEQKISKPEPKPASRGRKTKQQTEDENEPAVKRLKSSDHSGVENNKVDSKSSIYDFTVKDISGKDVSLTKYKGHVCIIVNVASRCGHTSSNYKEFVELYDKYNKEKGLRILAFPCNQFGKQEPGDNEKICEFAKKKNVKFDMFEKIEVNGKNANPLWKYLKANKQGPKGENIDWNFTKFLIDQKGQVVERFKPSVKPLALLKDLEKIW